MPSPASLLQSISMKLTNSNYILWCNQVQPVIKGHGLSHFLVAPIILPQFDTIADHEAGIVPGVSQLGKAISASPLLASINDFWCCSSSPCQHLVASLGETPCAFSLYCSRKEEATSYGSACVSLDNRKITQLSSPHSDACWLIHFHLWLFPKGSMWILFLRDFQQSMNLR